MSAETSDLTSIDKYVTNSVEFKAHVPYMGLEDTRLTVQQEKLVMLICSGMTIAAAGRGAGYSSKDTAYNAARLPQVKTAVEYFKEQMREEVRFTHASAHLMYMDAYQASATATEMKNTVDSLVKLHGLAAPEQQPTVNIQINATTKHLERMSDEELLSIAGKDNQYLNPAAVNE
jgi:phage terminase small subunit